MIAIASNVSSSLEGSASHEISFRSLSSVCLPLHFANLQMHFVLDLPFQTGRSTAKFVRGVILSQIINMLSNIVNMLGERFYYRVATFQGKTNFSRCQGKVREFLPFEPSQGIVREFCHDIVFRMKHPSCGKSSARVVSM